MTKKLMTIWQEFERRSLSDAPVRQKVEMQKAFYLGASALFSILEQLDDRLPDEEGAKILNEVFEECTDYLKAAAEDYDRRVPRGFGRGSTP